MSWDVDEDETNSWCEILDLGKLCVQIAQNHKEHNWGKICAQKAVFWGSFKGQHIN